MTENEILKPRTHTLKTVAVPKESICISLLPLSGDMHQIANLLQLRRCVANNAPSPLNRPSGGLLQRASVLGRCKTLVNLQREAQRQRSCGCRQQHQQQLSHTI